MVKMMKRLPYPVQDAEVGPGHTVDQQRVLDHRGRLKLLGELHHRVVRHNARSQPLEPRFPVGQCRRPCACEGGVGVGRSDMKVRDGQVVGTLRLTKMRAVDA